MKCTGIAIDSFVECRRNSHRNSMQLLPGLILHGDGNGFTDDADAVLRQGMAWRLR